MGLHDGNGTLLSGVQDRSVRHRESRGMLPTWVAGGWLRSFLASQPVDVIVYEQPHLRGGGAADGHRRTRNACPRGAR